jgi:hypothetical protein
MMWRALHATPALVLRWGAPAGGGCFLAAPRSASTLTRAYEMLRRGPGAAATDAQPSLVLSPSSRMANELTLAPPPITVILAYLHDAELTYVGRALSEDPAAEEYGEMARALEDAYVRVADAYSRLPKRDA